ncbi:MAG: citryl-CoA lyase [Candidatus Ranarchaeia archaeon]
MYKEVYSVPCKADRVRLRHRKASEWKSRITKIECDKLITYGYDQEELIGRVPYSHGVYLMLRGELPNEQEGHMFNAILVASIDHGITPPSAVAARVATSGGAPLSSAVAAGLLTLGDHHGGAITPTMKLLRAAVNRMKEQKISAEEVAREIVLEYRKKGKRVPGLGHRWHDRDPRSYKLLELADELGLSGEHVAMERTLQKTASRIIGRSLSINVDGGIAPIALDMGFDPILGNALFLIGRIGGLVAHVVEEKMREKPMRRMWDMDYIYDGPRKRSLPDRYLTRDFNKP